MTIPASIVQQVKQVSGLNTEETRKICDAFLSTLIDHVKSGKSVTLKNCLTLKRVLRGDRNHKNPKTGEAIFKKAHYVLTMDVKPALKREFEEMVVAADEKVVEEGAVEPDAVDEEGTTA